MTTKQNFVRREYESKLLLFAFGLEFSKYELIERQQQMLRLVFATHEVLLRGNSLRRIETAMQRMELSLLAILPDSQRALISEGQPVILDITVTNSKVPGEQMSDDQ